MTSSFDREFAKVPRPVDHTKGGGSFWRKEPPVFGQGKEITKGGMFAPQLEWWNLPNFIKVLVTGYGGGKSFILAKRMIGLALKNAPVPVAIVCPNLPQAKLTTIPTIDGLLEGKRQLLGRGFRYRYNGTPPIHYTIEYRGRRATIYILSAERPQSLKGGNLAAVGMEEPFIQPEESFQQMIARIRHPDAVHQELAIAGTPENLNWGYELCEGELSKRYDVGVVHASTMANKSLPDDYAKRMLAGYDEKAASAYVQGRFTNLSKGVVYHAFDREENVVELAPPSGAQVGIGMDFNVNPMAATLFWWKGQDMHIFCEFEFPNADTEYAALAIQDIAWERFRIRVEDVFPDASGKNRSTSAPGGISDFVILKQLGFTIHSKDANPPRRDRYNATNRKFKSKGGRITLTIDPSCTRLAKYFTQYTHEIRNKKQGEEMSHLLDAATYPVAYLFPILRSSLSASKFEGS
jgi:hypothetical protein